MGRFDDAHSHRVTAAEVASTERFKSLSPEEQQRLLAVAEECERRYGPTRTSPAPRPKKQRTDEERQARRKAQRLRRALAAGRCELKVVGEFFTVPIPVKFRCEHCGKEFLPKRKTARFCSTKCRVYAHREKRAGGWAD